MYVSENHRHFDNAIADWSQIEATAEKWGVAIESILLKDINFSVELQQSLSSAATQKRIGESKVIAARAEVDAAKLMRQAADVSFWSPEFLSVQC